MKPGAVIIAQGDAEVTIALIVVAVVYVGLFCWLAVVGWARHRRMEREAYYRHETEKRLLQMGEAGARQILALRNEDERARWRRRREGLKLGGLITTALGLGILIGFQFIDTGDSSFAGAGGFPLIIGLALLMYAYGLYPKSPGLDLDTFPPPTDERPEKSPD